MLIRTALAALVIMSHAARTPAPQPRRHTRARESVVGLNEQQASHFAALALKCVTKEYPHKLDHVVDDASQVQSPRALHPAFYGCYDWHSCVHGHWLLARLLRLHPSLPEAREIRAALDANLTAQNIQAELIYFAQKD